MAVALLSYAVSAPAVEVNSQAPFSSQGILEEVISSVGRDHAFNWRRSSFELDIGYDYIDEFNNFDTDGWHLGALLPNPSGWCLHFGLRRYQLIGTDSSRLLGRTPFRQAAQPSRFEFFGGILYNILDGRSISRLSPMISDLQHAVFLVGRVHYAHPNAGWAPSLRDQPEPMAGQEIANSKYGLELGLRWSLYLPSAFGVFLEIDHQRPFLSPSKLRRWTHYASGFLWAF